MKFAAWLLGAVLVGLCAAVSSVAQKRPGTASEVLALEAKWNDAYQRRDFATMNSLLAEDFVITVEDGNTYSKSGYIAQAGDGTIHVEISKMSDLKVHAHGNTAVVTGAYHETGTIKGKPYEYHDRLTDVWVNIEGRWQLIASHYSIPLKR